MRFLSFPPIVLRSTWLSLLIGCTAAIAAPELQFRGVLGNSGVRGSTLVQFPDRGNEKQITSSDGLGLDEENFIWAFAGVSGLNRYSLDGRQVAHYTLPSAFHRGRRTLVVSGDRLILQASDQLWSLDIDAANGSQPIDMKIAATALSLNAFDGKVAIIDPNANVKLLDVSSGAMSIVTTLPSGMRKDAITLLPDGTLYIARSLRLNPVGSRDKVDLPGSAPYLQWAGDHLYSFAWHTTIQQLDAKGHPSPGVVYGGSSGSFIGVLPKDGEIPHPSGIVHLGDGRYATTGKYGVIHILEWDSEKQDFNVVRRLGAIHRAAGLAIDTLGRIWWNTGYWNWTDRPTAVLNNTTWEPRRDTDQWQVEILASGALSGLGVDKGNPALIRNLVDSPTQIGRGGDSRYDRQGITSIKSLPKNPTGAAVLGAPGKAELVVVDAQGIGVRIRVDKNGNARGLIGPVTLHLSSAKPDVTSLARTDSGELFAADGGAIVRLSPVADGYNETARYTAASNENASFGARVYIDGDGERLWISDTEKNRLLVLETNSNRLDTIASFQGTPETGPLNAPQRISATNGRAVVLDWENQRLLRLELTQ